MINEEIALQFFTFELMTFEATNYIRYINEILRPKQTEDAVVLDLFAGCGGLALGFEAAGFKTIGFEMNGAASESYIKNLGSPCFPVKLEVGYDYPLADIIIGGPPCQPFSVGGNQKGIEDSRDGFPIFIDAVKRLQPKVFMFENVRGLLYTNKWYFDLIRNELAGLGYYIEYRLLNAVHYKVPQNRERLFVVGHKSSFKFPKSHYEKTTVSDAIGDLMTEFSEDSKFLNASMDAYIAKYERASKCINPRDLYPDKPARTLTCRNLAGATGDMHRVRLKDGRRRRITINEAARLQSFPDWFVFQGNETQAYNQIGNAVPPLLAYQMALAIKDCYNQTLRQPTEQIHRHNQIMYKKLTLF
ncbi:DNA cytosine methyltransferase [Mucilaginibacter sp. 44-25]|uniref:DNA cytosine methyltransferase n=1 Tax=Mucilaginibacter sp. 44-25 TaxID=1895794 RepID=UPI0025FD0F52|nr:DNA cytosine methyltransferase [Mucilaginibacter sp. 44-25]